MNETDLGDAFLFSFSFFLFQNNLKATGAGGETGRVEGENPRSDCAPTSCPRRGWTTPLGALSSEGMGKMSPVLPVGNQVFPPLPLHFSWGCP